MFGLIKGVLGGRRANPAPAPAAVAPVDPLPQQEAEAMVEARRHLDAAELVQARALLEPYAATTHRLDSLMLLCRIRISQGELDAALELLQRALSLHPGAAELLETAAVAHEMKRQPVQALECWQKLVFLRPRPSAEVCINWMRAYVRAAKERQPRPSDVVNRVAALLDQAPDVTTDRRLAFAEWLYAYKPGVQQAVARYRAASMPGAGERDVTARWLGLAAWCEHADARLHEGVPLEGSPPVALGELKDVRVIPGFQWIPVLDDGAVVLSGFTMHRMKSHRELAACPQLMNNRDRLELRLSTTPRVVETPALLIGGMAQYYHQTIDYLSALAVAETLGIGTDRPLVVNRELAAFQREQLALLGYGEDRLLLVGDDEQVVFRDLMVPTRLVRGGQWMHPLTPQWYRRRLVPAGDAPADAKLYVSRRHAPRRRIANEHAVEGLLAARGYRTVYPEDMNIAQQAALFATASHLVAPGGAALTNMVFMPPGGAILVPVSRYAMAGAVDTYFDPLAAACGHRFDWLRGKPVAFGGERVLDADFEVDLDELARALDAAG